MVNDAQNSPRFTCVCAIQRGQVMGRAGNDACHRLHQTRDSTPIRTPDETQNIKTDHDPASSQDIRKMSHQHETDGQTNGPHNGEETRDVVWVTYPD